MSPWQFTDVAKAAGVTEPFYSFPTWFFDYDNDGWLDLFVSGYGINNVGDVAADYLGLTTPAERVRLFHNNRDGTFTDVTRAAGLYKVVHSMGSNFGDLDNDGWPDVYLGTGNPDFDALMPNQLYRNDGGRRFVDVTFAAGLGHLQKGHGVAFADLDNDGDQDIFEVMGGAVSSDRAYSALYRNPGPPHPWLGLELTGVRSNRSAIGARVKVTVEGPSGPRTIYRTVGSGGSFGASPLRLEIGLGAARKIRAVEVLWPATGQTQAFSGLEMRQRYRIQEGANAAERVLLQPFALASPQ